MVSNTHRCLQLAGSKEKRPHLKCRHAAETKGQTSRGPIRRVRTPKRAAGPPEGRVPGEGGPPRGPPIPTPVNLPPGLELEGPIPSHLAAFPPPAAPCESEFLVARAVAEELDMSETPIMVRFDPNVETVKAADMVLITVERLTSQDMASPRGLARLRCAMCFADPENPPAPLVPTPRVEGGYPGPNNNANSGAGTEGRVPAGGEGRVPVGGEGRVPAGARGSGVRREIHTFDDEGVLGETSDNQDSRVPAGREGRSFRLGEHGKEFDLRMSQEELESEDVILECDSQGAESEACSADAVVDMDA